MKERDRIGIYIDYTIRIPNFCASYKSFKDDLFSDKHVDIDMDDEIQADDVRMYWPQQMKNLEVENFYFKMQVPKDDYELRTEGFSKFFYNEEHLRKFLDEYSFNLFLDCAVPNRDDLSIINIAQGKLFDITLIDEYDSKRKIGNTYYFLAKNPVYPQTITFLADSQKIDESRFIAVWNPKKNPNQVNGQGDKGFLNWFMELEKKSKENV